MRNNNKRHLHRKLATAISGAALLVALLTVLLAYVVEFKRASDKTVVMLNQLLDTVESTAAIAAYAGNREIAADMLKGLLRNDIVHSASFSNDRGLALREARANGSEAQEEVVRPLKSLFGDAVIGRLAVVADSSYSRQEAIHSAAYSALNSSCLIGLTTWILLSMVRKILSRPLIKVSTSLRAICSGRAERLDLPLRNKDDEFGQLITDINGLLETLDEKLRSERGLRQEREAIEQQLRNLFETTSAGIFIIDGSGRFVTGNPTVTRVLGLRADAMDAAGTPERIEALFAEPEQLHTLMRTADAQHHAASADLKLKGETDAAPRWVHCLLSQQVDAQGRVQYEGVVYDITERLAIEQRIRWEADFDSLTGLLRRQAAERELNKLLASCSEDNGRHAILLIDLDRFKEVNDSQGHDAGDRVLIEVAKRLRSCVRSNDIVARLGGDEFLIVVVNCVPQQRVYEIAREIIAALQMPIAISATAEARIGGSIGISFRDHEQQTVETLLKLADEAMYEVKRRGRNGFALRSQDGQTQLELGSAPVLCSVN